MDCYIIGWLIEYVDDKDVTLLNTYGWAREASIHCSYHLLIAKPTDSEVLHLKRRKEEML